MDGWGEAPAASTVVSPRGIGPSQKLLCEIPDVEIPLGEYLSHEKYHAQQRAGPKLAQDNFQSVSLAPLS